MKKYIKLFLILFLIINNWNVFAENTNPLPGNFESHCYEQYYKIDKSHISENQTYKILIPDNVDLITQNQHILEMKILKNQKKHLKYIIDISWNKQYLQDNNQETFFEYDIQNKKNTLFIEFDEIIPAKSSIFNFSYFSKHFATSFEISTDKINYSKVSRKELWNFDYKYVKIHFSSQDEEITREKVKLYEISFTQNENHILVNSDFNDSIELYAKNKCKNKQFISFISNVDFPTNESTIEFPILLQKNPKFNIFKELDRDNDWIPDLKDNCKNKYNPDQKDSSWDGRWDVCSDYDNDGIIWYDDNCPYINNPDQEDVNNNKIWDVCEFDLDEDGIYDSIDTCRTIKNPEQLDFDYDGIWDACDNCKYFNPSQIDKNENWVWDYCDQKNEEFKKFDKDNDKVLESDDNCPKTSNPLQEDSDNDGIWDACDNCKAIKNSKQMDLNKNSIWDMCEDSDNDGHIWYKDNCLYISNSNQEDTDNNGIGNFCEDKDWDNILQINDNCPYDFNRDQTDIDKDWKWDICDDSDDRFMASNEQFFVLILIILALIFSVGITVMIRKIQ